MSASNPNESPVNRREFLVRLGITGALIAGSGLAARKLWQPNHFIPGFEKEKGLQLRSYAPEISKVLPSLAIAHGTEHEKTIRAAMGLLGGMERFIQHGDVVMIKPNVAFDRPPALAATTHPDALRAVAKLCFEAGASKVIVADNPINSPTGCFFKSGLTAVASEMNLDLLYPETNSFAPLSLDGEILKEWTFFNTPFKKATKVIGLAPCKDHNLCHASMTTKNWYGLLGGRRNQFHQDINGIIVELAMLVRPTFVVLDGTASMMANGPTGGSLADLKPTHTLVVSTDGIAADAFGATLLDKTYRDLPYITSATERGLGTADFESLQPVRAAV